MTENEISFGICQGTTLRAMQKRLIFRSTYLNDKTQTRHKLTGLKKIFFAKQKGHIAT